MNFVIKKEIGINAEEYEEIINIINDLSIKDSKTQISYFFKLKNNEHISYIKAIYQCFRENLFNINNSKEKKVN